jgi:CRP-like cAMP-binding protein
MIEELTGFNIYDIVGMMGVALYLGSYAALQMGFLRGQGYAYAAINAAAASSVLFSLMLNWNLSSALIQIFWIIISAVGITRLYLMRRRLRFTPEERDLIETVLPDMPRERARELLNLGYWMTGDVGHVITTENEPVPDLTYLAEGEAAVRSNDKMVALIKRGSFIGEITCLNGENATGTVELVRPSLIFSIDALVLREFLSKNADIKDFLEISFARELRHKLVALNKVISESADYAVNQRGAA